MKYMHSTLTDPDSGFKLRLFTVAILLILWVFATGMNLNKAYHIDDTVHLETAQWILQNPLHPMSGRINWDQDAGPIHLLNQPHLYFYLLAVWGHFFGFGEIEMHLLQSLFTLACILLIFTIAKILVPRRALFLTALVAVSPAFVVGQNLMVDIPLLSFWLAFYYVLINPGMSSETRRFVLVGFMAGLACLVKYSSVPLVPVMLVCIVLEKEYRLLWTIAIPIVMLGSWSAFNYLDYGSIHILDRPSMRFSLDRTYEMGKSFLICLGAVLPYSPLFFWSLWPGKRSLMRIIRLALAFVLISLAFVIVEIYIGRVSDRSASRYFRSLFLGNGIALTLLALKGGVRNLSRILGGAQRPIIVLYLWLVSGCLFVILFSPFMATRHVLLVILPCSLLIACFVETGFSRFWGAAALLLTVFLTMALGISDRMWAGYYKEKAALIQSELADRKADIYFSGHWGWQWYAKQKGMKELEASKPEIKPGDYLVYPESIPQQALDHIPSRLHLELVKVYTAPPRKLTFFKTDEGTFYSSSHGLPWAVNLRPFAPIKVYRVR